MTARLSGSRIVRLCLPIATAVGRLDPPTLVLVTAYAATWLFDHEYAERPLKSAKRGDAIDLTGDAWLAANNARPGDSYLDPEIGEILRRPANTEFFGAVPTRVQYALRSLNGFYREMPEYPEMVEILAPAIAAMDARKPPLFRLTEPDVVTIERALDDFEACKIRAHERMNESAHRARRRPAAHAANAARREKSPLKTEFMNAEAAKLVAAGIVPSRVNRKLGEMFQRTARQIRNIRAGPAESKKGKSR